MDEKTLRQLFKNRSNCYANCNEVVQAIDEDCFIEILKEALILPVVSRSIGLDTKPTLMELTQEQIDKEIGVCSLCIYHKNHKESEDCRKCINENEPNQYYG